MSVGGAFVATHQDLEEVLGRRRGELAHAEVVTRHLRLTYPPYHFAGAHQFISVEKVGKWIRNYYFVPDLIHQIVGWMWTLPMLVLVVVGLDRSPLKREKPE